MHSLGPGRPAVDKDHPAAPSIPADGRSALIHPAQLDHYSFLSMQSWQNQKQNQFNFIKQFTPDYT